MTTELRGLIVNVLRPADFPDCTNNGISGRHARLTVVGIITPANERDQAESDLLDIIRNHYMTLMPDGSRVFAPTDDAPAAVLRYSAGFAANAPRPLHLAPLDACQNGQWVMAGGNYATGDSRWSTLLATLTGTRAAGSVVPIHDRIEH
jgi:hypothetical protein